MKFEAKLAVEKKAEYFHLQKATYTCTKIENYSLQKSIFEQYFIFGLGLILLTVGPCCTRPTVVIGGKKMFLLFSSLRKL